MPILCPRCGAYLRLAVYPPRFADIECERCDYSTLKGLEHRSTDDLKDRLVERRDFLGTLLFVFQTKGCKKWSDVLFNVGFAEWVDAATFVRPMANNIDQLQDAYTECLNSFSAKLGEGLSVSKKLPSLIPDAWNQFGRLLFDLPNLHVRLEDVVVVDQKKHRRYRMLHELKRRKECGVSNKTAYNDAEAIRIVKYAVADSNNKNLDPLSMFTPISNRFNLDTYHAVTLFNKCKNLTSTINAYGEAQSIEWLWDEVSTG